MGEISMPMFDISAIDMGVERLQLRQSVQCFEPALLGGPKNVEARHGAWRGYRSVEYQEILFQLGANLCQAVARNSKQR